MASQNSSQPVTWFVKHFICEEKNLTRIFLLSSKRLAEMVCIDVRTAFEACLKIETFFTSANTMEGV